MDPGDGNESGGEGYMLRQIQQEIAQPYYQQNFHNDGTRFVAWYLRRVLRRDAAATMHDITDGANDKQIDAVVVDDDERRVIIVQGKFLDGTKVDAEPLREILGAWARLNDLGSLQSDCNDKLRQKLEAVRQAIDDEYDIEFELLTTGEITDTARDDLKAFATRLEETTDLPATLQLVDTEVLQARLAEADALELPSLNHAIVVDPDNTLVTKVDNERTIITLLPLTECLRFPGIKDGQLFRKNVRQSLGLTNKVNRGMRETLNGDHVKDFFFIITA